MYALSFEHPSKSGVNAGSCTLVRKTKRMSYCSYVSCLAGIGSCVFEQFVIFVIHQNYVPIYVQKLR